MRLKTCDPVELYADETPVHELLPTRLWMLTRGRNAWHSTWIKRYSTRTGLYTTRHEAERQAERQRGQGTVFYLSEEPCLLVRTPGRDVVVLDVVREPFRGLDLSKQPEEWLARLTDWRGVQPGSPAGLVLRAITRRGVWKGRTDFEPIHFIVAPSEADLDLRLRPALRGYCSVAERADWSLAWADAPYLRTNTRGRNAAIRSFQASPRQQQGETATSRG